MYVAAHTDTSECLHNKHYILSNPPYITDDVFPQQDALHKACTKSKRSCTLPRILIHMNILTRNNIFFQILHISQIIYSHNKMLYIKPALKASDHVRCRAY